MPEKPVAKLALDTRAHGPYFCQKCDAENEDALLMSDASVVCPECKEPMPEFQPFTDVIVSASPISVGKGAKKKRWVIEWTGQDTSRDGTVAYDSQEEAFEAAADWMKESAENELESVVWDEDDEDDKKTVDTLKEIVAFFKEGKTRDGIIAYLDYQSDMDPEEHIALGPSGNVSDSSGDFAYLTK